MHNRVLWVFCCRVHGVTVRAHWSGEKGCLVEVERGMKGVLMVGWCESVMAVA